MLYPHNGDRILTTDFVTSLHRICISALFDVTDVINFHTEYLTATIQFNAAELLSSLRKVVDGSVTEWLASGTQAQKGPGSNRSRDAVG